MTRNQLCYAFLFVLAFLSCNKADDDMGICEILINEEFVGGSNISNVFAIDLDQDAITDIEIIAFVDLSQVGFRKSLAVETTNSSWKLIGLKSSYHTCRDSFFSVSNSCAESLYVYTDGCDSTGANVQFEPVNIPISFSDLETNAQDSIETEKLTLRVSAGAYFDLFCGVENGNYLYTWISHETSYSYIKELEEFEILCKDTNGNFASVIIKNQEPYSAGNFHIDKIILCR